MRTGCNALISIAKLDFDSSLLIRVVQVTACVAELLLKDSFTVQKLLTHCPFPSASPILMPRQVAATECAVAPAAADVRLWCTPA